MSEHDPNLLDACLSGEPKILFAYDEQFNITPAGEAHVDEHLASNQEAAGSNPVTRSDLLREVSELIQEALQHTMAYSAGAALWQALAILSEME